MEGNAEAAGETFLSIARGGNGGCEGQMAPVATLPLSLTARVVVFRLSKLNWRMLAMLNIAETK